jgi:hypothetical protein
MDPVRWQERRSRAYAGRQLLERPQAERLRGMPAPHAAGPRAHVGPTRPPQDRTRQQSKLQLPRGACPRGRRAEAPSSPIPDAAALVTDSGEE